MGVDEGNIQVLKSWMEDGEIIMENCPITIPTVHP